MNIEFEKMRFKNINSFGNSWTEFYFKPGMNIISAPNSSGKSTLTDVICFCLYGKPYRSIRIEELINNKNNKNLMTEVYFKIQDDSYCIQRGLKPNILKIIKNNEELELLSHKSLIQDEIDKILTINLNLFKQIISLSLLNNKPFLSLDAKDKREITESIFNIKVFARMLKSLKKNNSITKNSIDLSEKEIKLSKENLESLVGQIKSLTKLKDEFDSNKEKDLKSLVVKCTVMNDDLRKIHLSIAELGFKEVITDETLKKLLNENKEKKFKEFVCINNKIVSKEEELKFISDENNFDDFETKFSELKQLVSECYVFIKQLQDDNAKRKASEEVNNREKSEQLNKSVIQHENEIKNLSKEKTFLNRDYIEKNLAEVIDKKKILTENKIKISSLKEDIELLKSKEGYCSHCKQEVSEDHKKKEINSRENSINSLGIEIHTTISDMESIISNHIRENNEKIDAKILIEKESIHDLKRELLNNESKMRDGFLLLDMGMRNEIKIIKDRKENIIKEYIKALKLILEVDIEDLEKQIKELRIERDSIDSQLNKIEKEEKKYLQNKSEFEKLSIQEKNLKDNMLSIATSMKELEDKLFTADIDSLKADFETKKKNYQELKSKCEIQKRKLKIEEVIKEVLDEDGIKKYFFSRLIPKLNQIINEYLNHFGLPVYFKFDEMFEYEIKEVGNNLRSYQSFSGGERFRIDLSIILSFIELNKLINNFNCNIQVFDELLDSGGDSEVLEGVLEKLKEITDKNDMATYIISHRPIESSEYIDNIIKVEKKSGFSCIHS